MHEEHQSTECCPPFDPAPWDDTSHTWQGKLFVKESIPELFHIPLPSMFAKAVKKMWNAVEAAGMTLDPKDALLLTYDPSPWKSELYMAVKGEVPGIENTRISGSFQTKVYDGPYSAVPKWIKDMDVSLAAQGKKALRYYFHFAMCPKCARKYGHNWVVTFAQVEK